MGLSATADLCWTINVTVCNRFCCVVKGGKLLQIFWKSTLLTAVAVQKMYWQKPSSFRRMVIAFAIVVSFVASFTAELNSLPVVVIRPNLTRLLLYYVLHIVYSFFLSARLLTKLWVTVKNSSIITKHLYLILTFRSHHEIFIRRASSDEDLVMRSKCQNKLQMFGFDWWIFNCIVIPTKWIYFLKVVG